MIEENKLKRFEKYYIIKLSVREIKSIYIGELKSERLRNVSLMRGNKERPIACIFSNNYKLNGSKLELGKFRFLVLSESGKKLANKLLEKGGL